MKAIVGKSAAEIAPRLLGFLSLARQSGLRADVLCGQAGELCVIPNDSDLENVLETGPRHFTTVQRTQDQVTWGDGRGFRVHENRQAQGALEIATAVALSATPRPNWRQRVLFALRDEAVLGRVVRALLERGRDTMSMARIAPDHVHPDTMFLLLVRDAPLYVVLEVIEEGFGHVFYEACHGQQPDTSLGLFLPWGLEFPLVASMGARLDQPCVRQVSGRLAVIDLDSMIPVDAVLSPELPAIPLPVAHVPVGEMRIQVPLRLVALDTSPSAESGELWRVGPDMMDQLAADLACAEDRLSGALAQVVRLGDDEKPSVFIWMPTPAGEDDERLSFTEMPGFARARRRLPNLLLPTRHALLPTLVDETLRSVFQLRQGVLTVIDTTAARTLVCYRLRIEDFRPLRSTLVDYTLHLHEPALERMCASASFDFEPLVVDHAIIGENKEKAEPKPSASIDPPQPPVNPEDEERPARGQVAAQNWTGSPAREAAPAPAVHLPTRLDQATRNLIEQPGNEDHWLDFFQASLALGRRADAGIALLRLLPTCEPARARSLLTACLGLAGRSGERGVLGEVARSDEPLTTLSPGLDLVLGTALTALAVPEDLTAELRRGLARLPTRVRGLCLPRLTWTAAVAAARLLKDPAVLEEARLWIEPNLWTSGVRASAPPMVAEALELQNGAANTTAILTFAESAGLEASERIFLRLAYAMRVLVLGGGVDRDLHDQLSKDLEAVRPALGTNAEKVQSVLRTLDHLRTRDRSILDGSALDPSMTTVLIEEGYLPPRHESAESIVARQGTELAVLSPADASEQVLRLFNHVVDNRWLGLEALPGVASRLRAAGQQDALAVLRGRVAEALGQNEIANRHAVALTGLEVGLACALDPNHDPMPALASLVSLAGRLSIWDLPIGARSVLAALEPLPIQARRSHSVALYRLLREHGVIRPWSGERPVRVDELRVLLRLVNLLVVSIDDLPEGERLRRTEWSGVRERMRQDLMSAR